MFNCFNSSFFFSFNFFCAFSKPLSLKVCVAVSTAATPLAATLFHANLGKKYLLLDAEIDENKEKLRKKVAQSSTMADTDLFSHNLYMLVFEFNQKIYELLR